MKSEGEDSITRDAAIAAATVIVEEFFPHCPNGITSAIHERIREIIGDAIDAAESIRWRSSNEPSMN
jgi:hypothetical protein